MITRPVACSSILANAKNSGFVEEPVYVYTVIELWQLDGRATAFRSEINVSHAYTNIEASKAHMERLVSEEFSEGSLRRIDKTTGREKNPVNAEEVEVWELYCKDHPFFFEAILNDDNWIQFSIHRQELRE
jgi:hypothetical protein